MKKFVASEIRSEVALGGKKVEAPGSFLLVYPNSYYLGMSNLGFHAILSLVDSVPGWYAERAFLGYDRSLEKRRTFSSFDVIGFSISYEVDFLNLPRIFREAKIPPRSRDRRENQPLIIAGGIAMAINPEPIAELVDAVLIGEAEEILPSVLERLNELRSADRREVLKSLAAMDGVYVPRFYRSRYDGDGRFSALIPEGGVPFPVRRSWIPDPGVSPAASRYLTPNTVFGRRGLIEIGRGCTRQCRFCAAGYLYRPPRNIPAPAVLAKAKQISAGSRRLGLVSPSPSDHPAFEALLSALIEEGFSPSISSLRIESVSGQLLRTLAAGGQNEITIAPEAGSARLRKKINKDIPEESMAAVMEEARRAGLSRVKLYFLVGLPGETKKDIEGIVSLSRRLERILPLAVSVSPFIPKPHTPFQWAALDSYDSLKAKLGYLKSELAKLRRVKTRTGSARRAVQQAALSRGDRRMSREIEEERLRSRSRADFLIEKENKDKFFPWLVVDSGVEPDYLWEEYQRSKTGMTTGPCRTAFCRACGVC